MPTVVVIDRDCAVRAKFRESLSSCGFPAYDYPPGADAYAAMREPWVDGVVCGLDAFGEVCEHLKRGDAPCETPCLLVPGQDNGISPGRASCGGAEAEASVLGRRFALRAKDVGVLHELLAVLEESSGPDLSLSRCDGDLADAKRKLETARSCVAGAFDGACSVLTVLKQAMACLDAAVVILDGRDRRAPVVECNAAFTKVTGYRLSDVAGRDFDFLAGPESDDQQISYLQAALREGTAASATVCCHRKTGVSFWNDVHIAPVRDAAGRLSHFVVIMVDVSERRAMEMQLIQAQKMEAIGSLSGGIAHDFNNMLGVISGNLELMKVMVESGDTGRITDMIDTALKAAKKGAAVNKRLLAIARSQSLSPEVFDINAVLEDMEPLLRKSVGEMVCVRYDLGRALPWVRADVNQLESAILNLALNARDAMPRGGTVRITTASRRLEEEYTRHFVDVETGDYVMIAVEDSGTGISGDALPHLFEPFFSTKDIGKGTGLGLSMVFGFIKQSGGHINVYSEAGRGTVFRIYLPQVDYGEEKVTPEDDVEEVPAGEGETVLVVDDNTDLRQTAAAHLDSLGYRVVGASDAQEALRLLEDQGDIDILFTDIVMPGPIDGLDLARTASGRWPELAVVLNSGFMRHIGGGHGDPLGEIPWQLLEKPYRRAQLARALRKAVDDVR